MDSDEHSDHETMQALRLLLAPGGVSIVLVPFPLTPLAVFGYFLYRQLGEIEASDVILYDWCANSHTANLRRTALSGIIRLFPFPFQQKEEFYQRIQHDIESRIPRKQVALVKRMFNFSRSHSHRGASCTLCTALAAGWEHPEILLPQLWVYWRTLLAKSHDPYTGLPPIDLDLPTQMPGPVPAASSTFHTRPIFRSQVDRLPVPLEDKHDPVVGYDEMELHEERAALLHGKRVSIVIVGPPQSGKSTFAASLISEMRNIVKSLSTRSDWQGLCLPIKSVNLDGGTPTLDAIMEGSGQDRASHRDRKVEWNSVVAFEGLARFLEARREPGIIVADAPGKATEYAEVVSFPADSGIVLSNDWTRIGTWTQFLKRTGIECIAIARSRPAGHHESHLRSHHKRTVTGRVTGLERTIRSWDPFISYLARIFLFDVLPNMVERRKRRANVFYGQ
ncbi:MAG: hypothetical protein AAB367_03600 [Patescibacteria group bacterium]